MQLVIMPILLFQNNFPSPHKTTSKSITTETMRNHLLTMLWPFVIIDALEYKNPDIAG
jgi:hypothetical protein